VLSGEDMYSTENIFVVLIKYVLHWGDMYSTDEICAVLLIYAH